MLKVEFGELQQEGEYVQQSVIITGRVCGMYRLHRNAIGCLALNAYESDMMPTCSYLASLFGASEVLGLWSMQRASHVDAETLEEGREIVKKIIRRG